MTPKKKCLAWAFGTIIAAVVFAIGAICAFAFLGENAVGYVVGLIAAAFALSFFICGFMFIGDAKRLYCSKCGAKLNTKCPNCGADVAPGSAFCSECGQKL